MYEFQGFIYYVLIRIIFIGYFFEVLMDFFS